MPRVDATTCQISLELAARLDGINTATDFGYSRNKLIEKLLEECCAAIESGQTPSLPRTIADARSRMGRGSSAAESDLRALLNQKLDEINEREQQMLAKLESKIQSIRDELKGKKPSKK